MFHPGMAAFASAIHRGANPTAPSPLEYKLSTHDREILVEKEKKGKEGKERAKNAQQR